MFLCCAKQANNVIIELDEPPVKDQPPTEESGTSSDLAPRRVLVKQLIQKTQQWEYMVEWSGGLRTWCTADGAFASKVIATAAAPGASSDPSVDPALMRQLVTDFDMLGRKGTPTRSRTRAAPLLFVASAHHVILPGYASTSRASAHRLQCSHHRFCHDQLWRLRLRPSNPGEATHDLLESS